MHTPTNKNAEPNANANANEESIAELSSDNADKVAGGGGTTTENPPPAPRPDGNISAI